MAPEGLNNSHEARDSAHIPRHTRSPQGTAPRLVGLRVVGRRMGLRLRLRQRAAPMMVLAAEVLLGHRPGLRQGLG